MVNTNDFSDLGGAPVEDYSDLGGSSVKNAVAPQQTNPSLLPRIGADALAGFSQFGHGLLNAPYNIANDLGQKGIINPNIASSIPRQQNYNYGQMLGVNNPNLADKILQGGVQYAPYAAIAGPELAAQTVAGGIYGLTQSTTPIESSALGAATALTGAGLLKGAASLPGYLSKFAAQGLAANVGDALNGAKNVNNSDAFQLAKNNYQNYTNAESGAWNKLNQSAQTVDENGGQFDNTNYIDALNNKLSQLKGQSASQSGYARANTDAQSLLGDYTNDTHNSFSSAIEHNKALNQDYQNEITPGKSLPFNIVNYAKANISKTLNGNISNLNQQPGMSPFAAQLQNDLMTANQATAQKNQIFNNIVNPGGKTSTSTFSQMIKNNNDYTDPTGFVNDYVPKARGDGIQKMQQFSQMIGDDNAAKNIIKNNYFDSSFNQSDIGINPKAFVNKYNNLSNDQQNYLFNPQENQQIQSLSKILANHPNAMSAPNLLGHGGMGALVGLGAGSLGGHAELGAAGGVIAAQGLHYGLNKAFNNPAISNYFARYLTPSVQSNAAPFINANISKLLPSSLLTPQAINYTGGQ